MRKDPVVQRSDARRRIDSELIGKLRPQGVEGPQGIRVTAGSVERKHQQLACSLPEGIVLCRRRQQVQCFRDPSGLEARRRVRLHRGQAFLGQPPGDRLGELLVRKVRQGRTAPQAERLANRRAACILVAVLEEPRPFLHEAFEPPRIDRVRVHVEDIPGLPRHEQVRSPQRLERAAEVRYVDLNRVVCGARSGSAPQQLDEPLYRHDLPDAGQQDR